MTAKPYEQQSIRELQESVEQAQAIRPNSRRPNTSRAARLHLVDMLSRWSAAGIATLAGGAVYLAIVVGRGFPLRAAAWALMCFAALWVCRRLRQRYRNGDAIISRPFRWRADYTSAMSVLGVAFGSAPILLAPAAAEPTAHFQSWAVVLICSSLAGLLSAAHLATALAVVAPAALFTIGAALRFGDLMLTVGVAVTAAILTSIVLFASRTIHETTRRHYPRTLHLRRNIELDAAEMADRSADATMGSRLANP